MDSNIIMGVVIGLLVLLSAFFSATETAFSFVNRIRVQHSVENGDKNAEKVLYVIEHFDNALTAILICNNIVNLGCSSIATVLCLRLFGDVGSAIATGATTLLILTFGEVIPKCLAKEHCDDFSAKTAGLLKFITIVLTPLVFIFMKLRSLALKIAGKSEDAPSVTENELKYIVESIEEEGVLEESESEMVRSALDFDETTAEEILTPRVDVVFINIEDSQQKIKDIRKSRTSSSRTATRVFPSMRKRSTISSAFCTHATISNASRTARLPSSRRSFSRRSSYSNHSSSQRS